tara:strand:- start:135 stop:932 length:798 start_codon:yes stop_codon:yes gene_type:complete
MFEKNVKLEPDNKHSFTLLGFLYDKKKEFLKAVDNYQASILLNPNKCKIYNNIARIYHSSDIFTSSSARSRWHNAYPYYVRAAELGCDGSHEYLNKNGFYKKGNYLPYELITGKTDQSLDSANYFYNVGVNEYDNNNMERAIMFFEFAIKTYPNPDYFFNLGTVYIEQKNYSEAINILKNAIFLFHGDDNIKRQLGIAYLKNQNYGNAVRIYKNLTTLNPNSSEDLFDLANAYHRFGNWSNAWPLYKLSAEKGSQRAIDYIDSVQ